MWQSSKDIICLGVPLSGLPITYPDNVQRAFDLIIPNRNPADIPLLIWIHGGGWIGGEKRIANEFERFSYRGYAVLSIDYRFSQEAVFPAQLEDCKMAVRWARANADKYGYRYYYIYNC